MAAAAEPSPVRLIRSRSCWDCKHLRADPGVGDECSIYHLTVYLPRRMAPMCPVYEEET